MALLSNVSMCACYINRTAFRSRDAEGLRVAESAGKFPNCSGNSNKVPFRLKSVKTIRLQRGTILLKSDVTYYRSILHGIHTFLFPCTAKSEASRQDHCNG